METVMISMLSLLILLPSLLLAYYNDCGTPPCYCISQDEFKEELCRAGQICIDFKCQTDLQSIRECYEGQGDADCLCGPNKEHCLEDMVCNSVKCVQNNGDCEKDMVNCDCGAGFCIEGMKCSDGNCVGASEELKMCQGNMKNCLCGESKENCLLRDICRNGHCTFDDRNFKECDSKLLDSGCMCGPSGNKNMCNELATPDYLVCFQEKCLFHNVCKQYGQNNCFCGQITQRYCGSDTFCVNNQCKSLWQCSTFITTDCNCDGVMVASNINCINLRIRIRCEKSRNNGVYES